jgi:hypothetical protein
MDIEYKEESDIDQKDVIEIKEEENVKKQKIKKKKGKEIPEAQMMAMQIETIGDDNDGNI